MLNITSSEPVTAPSGLSPMEALANIWSYSSTETWVSSIAATHREIIPSETSDSNFGVRYLPRLPFEPASSPSQDIHHHHLRLIYLAAQFMDPTPTTRI